MGKSTISMAIFNSYVKLPEGTLYFFCCPIFVGANFPHLFRGHRGEIPHQVLVIHVMDHGPWTPVQQHSGAAYLRLLRSTLARHVGGDVESEGRKK